MEHGLNELEKLIKAQTDDHVVQIGHLRRLRNESALVGRKIEELEHKLAEQEKFISMLEKQFHALEDKTITKGLSAIKKEATSGKRKLGWFGKFQGTDEQTKS
jgi:hypothetical protein